MRIKQSILLLSIFVTLCCLPMMAMESSDEGAPKTITTQTELFFLPSQQTQLNNRLNTLLDNTKKSLLIAMYWLTDTAFIDKLIAQKNKGIDIQIIGDQSMLQAKKTITISTKMVRIMNKLLLNNIEPYIYPSRITRSGTMHHKFIVFDNSIVLTGSANFTGSTVSTTTKRINHENILILSSNLLAKKYTDTFYSLQREIINKYITVIASKKYSTLPNWLKVLCKANYKNSRYFYQQINSAQIEIDHSTNQQKRVASFINKLKSQKLVFIREKIKKKNTKRRRVFSSLTGLSTSESESDSEELKDDTEQANAIFDSIYNVLNIYDQQQSDTQVENEYQEEETILSQILEQEKEETTILSQILEQEKEEETILSQILEQEKINNNLKPSTQDNEDYSLQLIKEQSPILISAPDQNNVSEQSISRQKRDIVLPNIQMRRNQPPFS